MRKVDADKLYLIVSQQMPRPDGLSAMEWEAMVKRAFPPTPTAPAVDMDRVYKASRMELGYSLNTRERRAIDTAIAEYRRQTEGADAAAMAERVVVTADGVHVLGGDWVWFGSVKCQVSWPECSMPSSASVPISVLDCGRWRDALVSECYSTRQAAEDARVEK